MDKQNRQILFITAICFPILLLSIWISSLYIKINSRDTVRVVVTGYDPRDLLSGHYVVLRPLWYETDCSQFVGGKCHEENFEYTYRYYLPENDAILLDSIISRQRDLKLELEFAYVFNEEPVIKDFFINEKGWKNWISEYKQEHKKEK